MVSREATPPTTPGPPRRPPESCRRAPREARPRACGARAAGGRADATPDRSTSSLQLPPRVGQRSPSCVDEASQTDPVESESTPCFGGPREPEQARSGAGPPPKEPPAAHERRRRESPLGRQTPPVAKPSPLAQGSPLLSASVPAVMGVGAGVATAAGAQSPCCGVSLHRCARGDGVQRLRVPAAELRRRCEGGVADSARADHCEQAPAIACAERR